MSQPITPRHGMPLLSAGQSQKELTHNEALMLLDALISPRIEGVMTNQPPAEPLAGQCWIVGAAPQGGWTGQAHRLAIATQGGWRFADVPVGGTATLATNGATWRRISTGWQGPTAINPPSGGTVIDMECRTALIALITALISSGTISSA